MISTLLSQVPKSKQDVLCDFLIRLYGVYVDLHCELTHSQGRSPQLTLT